LGRLALALTPAGRPESRGQVTGQRRVRVHGHAQGRFVGVAKALPPQAMQKCCFGLLRDLEPQPASPWTALGAEGTPETLAQILSKGRLEELGPVAVGLVGNAKPLEVLEGLVAEVGSRAVPVALDGERDPVRPDRHLEL